MCRIANLDYYKNLGNDAFGLGVRWFKSEPTDRQTVYACIDDERDYQLERWGTDGIEAPHSLCEFLVYIRDYTEEALHSMSRERDGVASEKALKNLRKLAALAVAAQEQHGVRFRDDA